MAQKCLPGLLSKRQAQQSMEKRAELHGCGHKDVARRMATEILAYIWQRTRWRKHECEEYRERHKTHMWEVRRETLANATTTVEKRQVATFGQEAPTASSVKPEIAIVWGGVTKSLRADIHTHAFKVYGARASQHCKYDERLSQSNARRETLGERT